MTDTKRAMNDFKKDFLEILSVAAGIDKYYGHGKKILDDYMPKFDEIIKYFNKKYKRLKIEYFGRHGSFGLSVLIKEDGVKEIFNSAAARVPNLKSIGLANFNEADAKNVEMVEKAKDELYLTYFSNERGTETVQLEYHKKHKAVELIYDMEEIMDPMSPSFRILSFYAAQDYDGKIDVYSKAATLGFVDLDYDSLKKYREKWQPFMRE